MDKDWAGMASEEESDQDGDVEQLLAVEEKERYEQQRRIEKENLINEAKANAERLRQQHAEDKETQFVQEQEQMMERISGITLKHGRNISNDQLQGLVKDQVYFPLDDMEQRVIGKAQTLPDYFTIGILCRTSSITKSHNGKSYIHWDLTSLKKCGLSSEMAKDKGHKPSPLPLPTQSQSETKRKLKPQFHTQSGYKVVPVFVYEKAAIRLENETVGGVYVIFNPAPMTSAISRSGTPSSETA